MNKVNSTAVIMAGGTGGHIFPGLALAQALKDKGWQIHWLGTADKMEADIVPKHDIPIHFLDIKGVRGNGLLRLLKAPWQILKSILQARKYLKQIKPKVVIGFGGFASGPGGLAAKSLGLPLVIHEQNAVMGLTNTVLSKIANHSLLAFPVANNSKQFRVIGNPVRQQIVDLNQVTKRVLTKGDTVKVLVVGGSLGARVFNQSLPSIFAQLQQEFNVSVHHQAGKGNGDDVKQSYQQQAVEQVVVDEFIDDMTAAFSWADIVVCRAGALTVSELSASGNVGIFVPLPHAVDDHQTANANTLVHQDAGILVKQSELEQQMYQQLSQLLAQPSKINQMQENAKQAAVLNTTEVMTAICEQWK